MATQYGIDNEKIVRVMLYHEVMWYLADHLIQDKVITIPTIFKDEKANKHRLKEVVFFIEGGVFQNFMFSEKVVLLFLKEFSDSKYRLNAENRTVTKTLPLFLQYTPSTTHIK